MHRIRFFTTLIAALALVVPTLQSASESSTPPSTGPKWRHAASKDFERTNPGLGYSWRFESDAGWIDLYQFDFGRAWKNGTSDPFFEDVLNQTIEDVRAAEKLGHYRDLEIFEPEPVQLEGTDLRRVRLLYEGPAGKVESYLFLTCMDNKIIKFRVSLHQPVSDAGRKSIEPFIIEQIAFFRKRSARADP